MRRRHHPGTRTLIPPIMPATAPDNVLPPQEQERHFAVVAITLCSPRAGAHPPRSIVTARSLIASWVSEPPRGEGYRAPGGRKEPGRGGGAAAHPHQIRVGPVEGIDDCGLGSRRRNPQALSRNCAAWGIGRIGTIAAGSAASVASGPSGHDELPRGAVAWAGRAGRGRPSARGSSQEQRRVAHYQDAINERALTIDGGGCAPARSAHNVIATTAK
jgi:hypothetical protein